MPIELLREWFKMFGELDHGTQKRGHLVTSSKTRQPKLQTSRVSLTAPVRTSSGALNPTGVIGFFGGCVRKYAV